MKKIVILSMLLTSVIFANEELQLSKDKTYILSFFASWCPSCKKELPQLGKLQDSYQKRGIEIIGIDVDKKLADGKRFQEKMKEHLTFRVVDDTANTIIHHYKPLGMPAVYIIKNNEVCSTIFGAEDNLAARLEEELQQCEGKK